MMIRCTAGNLFTRNPHQALKPRNTLYSHESRDSFVLSKIGERENSLTRKRNPGDRDLARKKNSANLAGKCGRCVDVCLRSVHAFVARLCQKSRKGKRKKREKKKKKKEKGKSTYRSRQSVSVERVYPAMSRFASNQASNKFFQSP